MEGETSRKRRDNKGDWPAAAAAALSESHCHSLGNSTRTAEWAKKKNEMSTNDGAIDQNAEWGNINMEKHEMSNITQKPNKKS